MGRNKRGKTQKAKKGARRTEGQRSRKSAGAAQKSAAEAARRLDRAVQEFDRAVDGLQSSLEQLRGTLPELVAIEVRRDRLRLVRALADDGIFDSLQRLARALEDSDPGELPESLVPVQRSARMAVDRICRSFEAQAVYQPGESLTVTQEQVKDFDWSADCSGELTFPAQVEILRSGWRAGDTVLVLPKAVRRDRSTPA
jgi:hypothetical protein